MIQNPLVSIVIANFNGEGFLNTCLKSVLSAQYSNFEIIIVDDGSNDGSIKIIKSFQRKDRRVSLIVNSKNVGAAASRNKAIKVAKGEIVIFLDNDTEVDKNWLGELVKPLIRNQKIGASQSLLLDFEKRDLIQMAGGLLIPQTGWLVPFYQWQKFSRIRERIAERNIVAISAALAVRKDVIDKVEDFDEKEAIYTEDLDFCWRIWLAGFRIVLVPNSRVFHWTKSVAKRAGMKASYRQIYFHLAKNSFCSILKNYSAVNIFKYFPLSVLINFGRGFVFLFARFSSDALLGSLNAFVWTARNLSDITEARKKIQHDRKFGDEYLMRKIFTSDNIFQVYVKYFS